MEISFTRVLPVDCRPALPERMGPRETPFESWYEFDAWLLVSLIECRAFRFARSEFMYNRPRVKKKQM